MRYEMRNSYVLKKLRLYFKIFNVFSKLSLIKRVQPYLGF